MTPDIRCNGYPVVISAHYVTGDIDSDWFARQFVGEYASFQDLNAALPGIIAGLKSIHWRLELDFQDKE